MRQFNKLKMFLHAESLPNQITLRDDQMVGFIRFEMNLLKLLQVEIPLKYNANHPSGMVGG
jgi:hypothetical protein